MNNTPNAVNDSRFHRWILLSVFPVALVLLAAPVSYAQEDDEIFELSPFTIEPEEGWVATETLAGTRLRTNFRDVAAQVEVFTMEFMEDYAINSLEESLIYSLNVANAEDRISGNGQGFGNQAGGVAQQIRGVGGGTVSRNFFRAFTNSENYNVSRITIASGPQSILFGTGQPAGVLDVTLNRAEISEDFGKISFQVDSFDGHRVALDYNKVLIEDKLAIRVALLNKDTKQDWKPNYDKDERVYATVTWKPWENTTIMGHYEHAEREWSRVNRFLPFDNVSLWHGWGSPAFDNSAYIGDNGQLSGLPDIYNSGPSQAHLLINNDGSHEQPTTTYRNMATIDTPNQFRASAVNNEADGYTLLDDTIFPTGISSNWAGAVEQHATEADIYDVFIEQKLADNWYIELGAHKEDQTDVEWDQGIEDRAVKVDPNIFMGDGVTPNPHFGEFYVDGRPGWQNNSNESENWRATMSYEFDFEDHFDSWFRWFGRHRVAALKSRDKSITGLGQQGYRYRLLPDVNTLEEPFFANDSFPSGLDGRRWADAGSRGLHARHYLNESNGFIGQRSDFRFDGTPITIQDENGKSWTIDPNNTGYFDAQGKRLVSNNAPQGINTQLDTRQFGYQGFFWEGRIVATYGWRKDSAKAKNFIDVGRDDGRNVVEDGVVVSTVHPNGTNGTGLYPHVDDSEFGPWQAPQSGITRTKGAVVRPLSWLSLFWNESDTFQPNIGRFDPYGTEYPGAQGQGQDLGVRLDFWDDKISIKYNEFELTSSPSRAANTPFNRWRDPVWNVANRYRTLTGVDDYPGAGTGGFRERGRCCYWVMSDNTATGEEIQITARPIEGLNIRFTYTDREAVESNIGNIWFQWIDERLEDSWTKFSVPEGGVGDPRDLDGDGEVGTWTWDTAWYNDNNDGEQTLAEYYQDVTVNGPIGKTLIQALDGKKNEFDRARSANINVNYRFSEGRLNGFNVGGAVRWRDAPTVGYEEIIVSGIQSPDLTKPLAGAIDMTYDVSLGYRGKIKLFGDRNYRVQGTIRNLFDDGDTFPVIKSVIGNNLRVARKTPRQFILSVDIDL